MKHLVEAHDTFGGSDLDYIEVNTADHSVKFTIQDGPIKEVGLNGIQAVDMLEFCKQLFKSLDNAYPCQENKNTITNISKAIHWQEERTKDREARQVEGKSEA